MVETERAWQSLGQVRYGPTEAEKRSLIFRRSLYIAQDMKEGDVFTADNLRAVRPGHGLHPRHYETFLGKRASMDLNKGDAVEWGMLGHA